MTPASVEPEAREGAATRRVREGVATQRIRVGALGLAGVFLLVMLATALLHAAADTDLANHPAAATANEAEPAEPLAQLGVAPGNPTPDPAPRAPAGSRPVAR